MRTFITILLATGLAFSSVASAESGTRKRIPQEDLHIKDVKPDTERHLKPPPSNNDKNAVSDQGSDNNRVGKDETPGTNGSDANSNNSR